MPGLEKEGRSIRPIGKQENIGIIESFHMHMIWPFIEILSYVFLSLDVEFRKQRVMIMRLLLVMIVLLAVVGTSIAVQLTGPAGKEISANLTGNNSLNASNNTQNGLAGWGTSHDLTIDSENNTTKDNESVMETPTQAAGQHIAE